MLGTKNGSAWEGVALTRDHKPNLRDEKQRPSDLMIDGSRGGKGGAGALLQLG